MPLDQFDEIGWEFGKVGQRLMDHHRLGSGGPGSGAPGRALGRDAFTLHQKDGLIVSAGQDGTIAFDEHDAGSIGVERKGCNTIIALLETTHYMHNKPAGMGLLCNNPIRMGEDEPDASGSRNNGRCPGPQKPAPSAFRLAAANEFSTSRRHHCPRTILRRSCRNPVPRPSPGRQIEGKSLSRAQYSAGCPRALALFHFCDKPQFRRSVMTNRYDFGFLEVKNSDHTIDFIGNGAR